MRSKLVFFFLGALTALVVGSPAGAQQPTNRDQSSFTRLLEEDFAIRTEVHAVPAGDADLRPDDLVMGVVIAGAARAYPVNLMWKPENEILNDRVGGAAIAATW